MRKSDVFNWDACEQRVKSHLVNCNKPLEDCLLCDCALIIGEFDERLQALERCIVPKDDGLEIKNTRIKSNKSITFTV